MKRFLGLMLAVLPAVGCSGSPGLTPMLDSTEPAEDSLESLDLMTGEQIGDRGSDGSEFCEERYYKACCGNAVCWFDSCGNTQETVVECPSGCQDARCKNCTSACTGKACGADGCGGDCGFCTPGKCAGMVWTAPVECIEGACTGGGNVLSCDDGEVCTDDVCVPKTGCGHQPNSADCDDGNSCTTRDLCSGGVCNPGESLDCDDLDPCTKDTCVSGTGCQHDDEPEGTVCSVGACDGLSWNSPHTCKAGVCSKSDVVNCDDGASCTIDGCVPTTGCTNVPSTGKCFIEGVCIPKGQFDGGNECRLCQPEVDAFAWTVLEDGESCGAEEYCYKGICGTCLADCVGKECGSDGCGGVCGTCQGACANGWWTKPTTCVSGRCEGVGDSVSCDDGKTCTADECDAVKGCTHTALDGSCLIGGQCYNDGQTYPANQCLSCSTSNSKSSWTTCASGGVCYQESCCLPSCSGKECGDDGCGGTCGTCGGGCAGSTWNKPGTCTGGRCEGGGEQVSCNDGLACTSDSCSPLSGCTHSLLANKCLIEGECYDEAQTQIGNACLSCESRTNTSGWTTCAAGGVCFLGSCCSPDCGGRVCGDNGCGGSCGVCSPTNKCSAGGQCVPGTPCTVFPSSWGPIGAVSALQTPADTTIVQSSCFDYTGDGKGDNGMRGLAGQVKDPITDDVNSGNFVALFGFPKSLNFANSGVFELYGLTGQSAATPPATSGDFYADRISYGGDCRPVNRFEDARIAAGGLTASSSDLWVKNVAFFGGSSYMLHLTHVRLKATVDGSGTSGVELSSGILSGVMTKQELTVMIDSMQAECDAAPADAKPDFCSYLTVAKSAMVLLFDLHQNGDGTFSAKSKELPGDAASVCLQFSTSRAVVVGMMP